MSKPKLVELEDRIEYLQQQLDLVHAIDRIRDEAETPAKMMTSVVGELSGRFDADCCVLAIIDPETDCLVIEAEFGTVELGVQIAPEQLTKLAKIASASDGAAAGTAKDLNSATDGFGLSDNMFFVLAAIEMDSRPLGFILLTRLDKPFCSREIDLLNVAEDHLDSAIVQCNVQYELQRRNRELETIYRIDHIRDLHLPFDEMLQAALDVLCSLVESEMGFIMLYDHAVKHMQIAAIKANVEISELADHYEIGGRIAHQTLEIAELVCHNGMEGPISSIMCIPLILGDEIIGVFGLMNRLGRPGFTEDDRRLMNAVGSQMDTAIFEGIEVRKLRQVLGRSVDPRVLERALAQRGTDLLKGERSVISVFYADIRGSTNLAETTEPELFVGFINDYLGRMADVVFQHEGTVDKFIGDEVMALLGAPFAQQDHALRAVRVGLEMQQMQKKLIETWQARGILPVPIGVGIATGELLVGEIGSNDRSDYTAIGRVANLGARICSAAAGGEVLVSEDTFRQIESEVEATAIKGVQMKGLEEGVTVYRVDRLLT
jgi:adenylate cyclase